MKREKSCGIVVFLNQEETKVLLVHHRLGHWGIPKGHRKLGESEKETALREVFEETGVEVQVLDSFREVITYSPKAGVLKDVVFFLGTTTQSSIVLQEEEVLEVCFVSLEEAMNKISYGDEREFLQKATLFYSSNVSNEIFWRYLVDCVIIKRLWQMIGGK